MVSVNVVHQLLWSSAEHRSTIYILNSPATDFAAHEVEIVAIGREAQTDVVHLPRRNDLSITVRGNIAKPQTLEPIVVHNMQDVFSVGRNRGFGGVAGFSDLGDGEILESGRPGAGKKCIHTIACGQDKKHSENYEQSQSEFMLARSRNHSGAAGRWSNCTGSDACCRY